MEERVPIFLRRGIEGRCSFCSKFTDFYLISLDGEIFCNICPECVKMLVECGVPFACTKCLKEVKG